ncbi:MAG: PBSX family phage terminase large subunit, partial [Longicatena sp.]
METRTTVKKKTIMYNFSDKHIEYIKKCIDCEINVAEGAIRAGKTVDNIYAFAYELRNTKDRIHLATGSTVANAKLNIGDANG